MINTNIFNMVRENVDLVVCVETTAMAGIGIKALKSDYLLPALEHFSGSSLGEADFCQLEQSSSYTLIPFKNANCFPEPSYRVFGPYTSPKKFLDTFDKLEFTGGGGESFNLGQEALAASLKVYEKLSNLRDADYKGLKHIIYIANCPMYDIPVMECTQFAGKSIESLCAVIKERHVSLSIFCARKVPFLLKLYENAGGDMMQAKEKNFAKDAKHMILLKNLALEERPVTPRAASQSLAPGVKTGNMQQNYPFNQNQQQNQQQSQMNTMQQQFMNQQNQNVAGAGKLANALTNPPQTSQPQDNTTLKNLLDRKPNPIQQNPGGAWQYQSVRGQMNPRMTGPGGMGGGMMPGGHGMATQGMGGVVMSNMQGMQGMQGGGPQSAAGGMMGNQGGGMVVGGHPQQQQQQQQGAMGQQQGGAGMSGPGRPVGPHHKEKQMIWAGEIEWKKKAGPNEQQIVHNVKCQVSSTLKNGQPEVLSDNWPTKLMMQLIPKQVIQNIGGHYFKDSKSVFFHPQESESLNLLSKEMSSGFAGYVQFGNCDIKVLILLYGSEKKSYLGFIPNDQNSFVERIMSIYRQGNMRQQQQQQAQQQQQQQMLNQQQNQGRGGMVSMQNASLIQQQQQGMMSQSMMGAAGGNQQQLAMSTASGGMMMTSAGQQQQQVISSQQGGTVPSTGAQMVMMPGGNMVRMQTTSNQQQSQQQFMRMQQQQQQQQQNSQQQNRPMMHGTALRQILQHPGGGAGGPGMPVMGGRGGGMQPGGGGMMMGAGRMTGPMVGNAGGMMGGGQPNQQGMMGGQQGNMMGGGQPNQQGGMMGGGQQQQGGENSLRDLLSNRDV